LTVKIGLTLFGLREEKSSSLGVMGLATGLPHRISQEPPHIQTTHMLR